MPIARSALSVWPRPEYDRCLPRAPDLSSRELQIEHDIYGVEGKKYRCDFPGGGHGPPHPIRLIDALMHAIWERVLECSNNGSMSTDVLRVSRQILLVL